MKKYLLSLSFLSIAMCMMAQSGTNSPYSLFGLGKLSDRTVGETRGMNGVGLAFRESNSVNTLNPASYSAVDSLSFIFDAGMSLQNTNFKEGSVSKNAKNANFEYATALFRVVRHLGMSFGILPYTNVGYSFSSSKNVENYSVLPASTTVTKQTQTYSGSGGLHQIYLGAGWSTPLRGLSIGANVAYLWGDIDRFSVSSYTDTYVKSLARQYGTSIHTYYLNFGLQYTRRLSKKYFGTIGMTFSPGHHLGSDATCRVISANSSTSVNDTATTTAHNAMAIPTEIGFGIALRHTNTWKVGLDYSFQNWKDADYPVYTEVDGKGVYAPLYSYYLNRHSVRAGGEYCKNEAGRTFFDRLRYRFGVGYSSPHLVVVDKDGPREISISAGVGIPIINSYNNRSVVNVGFTWQNYSASDFITENTLLLNIGITFNERWFAKWKFE